MAARFDYVVQSETERKIGLSLNSLDVYQTLDKVEQYIMEWHYNDTHKIFRRRRKGNGYVGRWEHVMTWDAANCQFVRKHKSAKKGA